MLEVHHERSRPGEPMKPLRELVTKWRVEIWDEQGGRDNPYHVGLNSKSQDCADELEVWLREADEWLSGEFVFDFDPDIIRYQILGTTRTEGKKR